MLKKLPAILSSIATILWGSLHLFPRRTFYAFAESFTGPGGLIFGEIEDFTDTVILLLLTVSAVCHIYNNAMRVTEDKIASLEIRITELENNKKEAD